MTAPDWARLVLLALIWGATFPLIEIAGPHLPALTLVALRVGVAAAVLAAVLCAAGMALPPRRVWPALLVMGALNNALPFTLITLAQGRLDGSVAAILNATTPLFALVVAALAGQERLTGARLAGLAAGLAGVAVLTGAAPRGEAPAMALCLAAALSYALAGVWARRRLAGIAPMAAALGMLAGAALLLGPLALMVDRPWTLAPPAAAWAAIAALALAGTALAYGLYFRLLADVGAVNLLLVTFLVPVSAIALSVAALGEVLLPRHLGGLGLILGGLALATRRRPLRAPSAGSSR
jgi:drug/metabolite transporter (DMT)-like permease